ncbi:MAG: DUF4337 domain-containing protein [Syntrophales bacterium]|nr:DUF4337 domain-containing protein [Syntrophales bacterium]
MAEAGEKKERWMTWVALTTAVLAVFAAVTTLYVGKYSSRAVMGQGQETNQWSYYQAKSIKSYIYEIQKQRLELELLSQKGRLAPDVIDKYKKFISDYEKKISQYDKDKEEIKAQGDALAKEKNLSQRIAGNFGYSLIFLQIAIMLSSVAALTKKKALWHLGLVTVSGWLFFFLDAFWLFY